jgi:hypothetical protein
MDVYTTASQRVEADPQRRLTVQGILDLYIETRQAHKMRRAEREILKPLGLDQNSYLAEQKNMDSDLVQRIAGDLINYRIPHLSVIVTGLDATGSHIFIADTNNSNNIDTGQYDSIGYAAIGAGMRHANAHFLMAGHTWHTPLTEALWNTFLAKKRSEVAPGVGETTDLYMIGPDLGDWTHFDPTEMAQLEALYQKTKKQEEAARHNAAGEITTYIKELAKAAAQTKTRAATSPEPSVKDSPAGS